jgi:hypothetical protein
MPAIHELTDEERAKTAFERHQKKAWRCKQCGFLEVSDAAAEAEHPHACRVCGGGVVFDMHAIAAKLLTPGITPKETAEIVQAMLKTSPASKTIHKDNWEVLADATPTRLKELGLEAGQVERHVPWPRSSPDRPPQAVAASAQDGMGVAATAGDTAVRTAP